MEYLPLPFVLAISFLFGTIIGSFGNVVICRLHTGKSLNNRSHCLSCGHTLSWYELVPLFSYLVQRGRCRMCGSWIPVRYVLVEFSTGVAFLSIATYTQDLATLVLLSGIAATLIICAVYDLYHFIIPDELVAITGGFALVLLGYQAWVQGSLTVLVYGAAGAAIAFGFYAGLWTLSKGRWIGFGDAKLALPLGLLVGLSGVFSFIVFSFWIGAVVSILLMLLKRLESGQSRLRFGGKPLKMKSEVPFAPFLIASFALVYFFHIDVLTLATHALLLSNIP